MSLFFVPLRLQYQASIMESNKNKMPTIASLKELTELLQSTEYKTLGDHVVTSDYMAFTDCSPFFQAIIAANAPIRMECMRVAIVKQGSCCPVVNSRPYACEPGDMIFINWGSVLDDDSFTPDTRFEGFALTEEYLRQLFGLDIPTMLKNPGLCFKVHLSEEENKVYKCYLDTIMSLSKLPTGDKNKALNALFVAALNFAEMLYDQDFVAPQKNWSLGKQQTEAFIQLVNQKAHTEHELSFYASTLCMSNHHLSMVVKRETGETAKTWIDRATISAIQAELRYSNKTLTQLANEFNFPSLSSFCKFFKRHIGLSPRQYRAEI